MTPTPPSRWFPRRGEIYWLKLDQKRPAIVISTGALNRHALDVCIVPLTTAEHRRFSLRVLIRAVEAGLLSDSWAKCDQVTAAGRFSCFTAPEGLPQNKVYHSTFSYREERSNSSTVGFGRGVGYAGLSSARR